MREVFVSSKGFKDTNIWQDQGKMRKDIDKKMIMMIFAAIINVDMHKEEIALENFPQLLEAMTELKVKGLTDCSK